MASSCIRVRTCSSIARPDASPARAGSQARLGRRARKERRAAPVHPTRAPASSRQEVSERIGLGRSLSPRAIAVPEQSGCVSNHDGEGAERAKPASRPLTRETSAGVVPRVFEVSFRAHRGDMGRRHPAPRNVRATKATSKLGQARLRAPSRLRAASGCGGRSPGFRRSSERRVLADCSWLQRSTGAVGPNASLAARAVADKPRERPVCRGDESESSHSFAFGRGAKV